MARASIDVIGDSASAVRALDQTTAAVLGTDDAMKKLAVDAEATTVKMVQASTQRVARLEAEAAAARELSATYVAGSREQAAAAELAARRTAAANRLLGIGSAAAAPSALALAGSVGRGLTTYVTAPTAFIGYEAVKNAIDFNQQMLLLRTQAGDTTDSIKQLSSQVLDLTKVAPQGPTVLAEGLYHLVSLGLRGADAMETLKTASIAAGMGIASIEDTATALGAAVVSGIKGAQDYQEAMSTLIATAGVGNMRFGDLAASVGNVLPAAAAAGVSLKEMGAALAVLTDRGMSADEAATRLRMSLALIQRPSHAATNALADMGVNADELGAQLRQPNGLFTVLQTLHDAIERVGVVRGNRDLLAAFGGARSGIGIQTLVQSLDSAISSYQGKLAQLGAQTQQVGQSTQAYLESPAYKLHNALAQVEADLVKLGTSLTPAVVGLADVIKGIADGFSALPGPVKEEIGIIVGLLALGGPLALAIKGVASLVGSIGSAFRLLPGMAAPAIAATEGELVGLEGSAAAAAAEVSTLQLGLLALGGITIAPIAIPIIYEIFHKSIDPTKTQQSGTSLSQIGHGVYQDDQGRYYVYQGIGKGYGYQLITPQQAAQYGARVPGINEKKYTSTAPPIVRGTDSPSRFAPTAGPEAAPGAPGSIAKFVLPYALQLEQSRAGLTKSTADDVKAARDIVAYAKQQIDSGHLTHAAMLQALQEEGSALNTLWSAQTKDAKAAAKAAKAAQQFTLPLTIQLAQARADALAALDPSGQGPTALQIKLAKEEKAAAMKAIDSHTLTIKAMIDAWHLVAQVNATLAQAAGAQGAIGTYHAVSTRALTAGLGLAHDQRVDLEERLAQAAAHRGYVPNQLGAGGTAAGGGGGIHIENVILHGVQDAAHLFWELDRIGSTKGQRRGQRH